MEVLRTPDEQFENPVSPRPRSHRPRVRLDWPGSERFGRSQVAAGESIDPPGKLSGGMQR